MLSKRRRRLAFDRLEDRLSLSGLAPGGDDLPPPGPESDPGDTPGHKEPIVYPTLPPTGPVGPG